jgi:hypothetical protein
MSAPADFAFWLGFILLEAFVCVLIAIRGRLRRYVIFSLYFGVSAAAGVAEMIIFRNSGSFSSADAFVLYFAGCAQTILLYFVVAELYQRIFFPEQMLRPVRIGKFIVAAGVALFSFAAVAHSAHAGVRGLFEYDHNLVLVTTGLALALLYPGFYNKGVPRHDRQLAYVLGVYFAIVGVQFLIQYLSGRHRVSIDAYGYWGLWLPVGVAYVFCDPAIVSDEPQLRL